MDDSMGVTEAIMSRRSVRAYDDRPVPEDVLMRVLEAGRIAPSASNYQPWHFIVVKNPETRKGLSKGRYAGFLKDTPVVIAGCGSKKLNERWYVVDTTIALENMVLAATGEGLGTCWIGSFDEEDVKSILKVPEDWSVVAMLALGYAKEKRDLLGGLKKHEHRRKDLELITSYEEFGKQR